MRDPAGRPLKGIRISLTQRCNLNCFYCHHEGEGSATEEMATDEVLRIVRVAHSLGITRVKYTGGEPLLRGDLPEIIGRTVSEGMDDTAITTNGCLLKARAAALWEAGLRRLNLSLPSLREDVYTSLTGGRLGHALEGAFEASRLGMAIKVNVVVMKGINENEVDTFIKFVQDVGGSLQLIELEDLGLQDGIFAAHHIDLSGIEREVAMRAERVMQREEMNRRSRYLVGGNQVDIVRPVDNPEFCSACTRLRVTSDGKLKPCLMRSDNLVDLLNPMRKGCTDDDLRALFRLAVNLRSPYYRTS